jgi:hypothetical protein
MRAILLPAFLALSLLATPFAAAREDSADEEHHGLADRFHALLAACHDAEKPDHNATHAEHVSWAHCVRDHIKAFFAQWRADHPHGAANETAGDAGAAHANATHGRPSH